jgi:periplasmic divalent cation tolerance protein
MDTEKRDIMVVIVTAANQEEAAKIAEQAVQSRQAACATTIPLVHSLYWWEGKVVSDQEAMVLLKTTADKFQTLQETILKTHSYKVPEIIGISSDKGLPQYLEWIRKETL